MSAAPLGESSSAQIIVKEYKANSMAPMKPRPRPTSAAVNRQLHPAALAAANRPPRPASATVRAPPSAEPPLTIPPPPPAPAPALAPARVPIPRVLKPVPKGPTVVKPRFTPSDEVPWEPTARKGPPPRNSKEVQARIDAFFDDLVTKHKANKQRSITHRVIDGELGECTPMEGVRKYPYSTSMRLYKEDFSALVCSTITHPYVTTSVNNSRSCPFDILSGMNYDDARLSGLKTWISEQQIAYVPKDIKWAKNSGAVGVRSECVQVRREIMWAIELTSHQLRPLHPPLDCVCLLLTSPPPARSGSSSPERRPVLCLRTMRVSGTGPPIIRVVCGPVPRQCPAYHPTSVTE